MTATAAKSPRKAPAGSRRDVILRAAERLFRKKGFHGTSTRDIAEAAGVSLGNIYNHFSTKEQLFVSLLADYEKEYFSPDQPLLKVFAQGGFPDNIERIGEASREMVRRFADYIRLMYVDVVEFDAKHVGRLFQQMRSRYTRLLGEGRPPKLARGLDPAASLMLVTWSFFNYFTMEKLFGVKGHYGMGDDEVIRFFGRVFRKGLLPSRN